jgi:hypothetical protein
VFGSFQEFSGTSCAIRIGKIDICGILVTWKVNYPPIANLISKSHSTMHHILVNGPKSIRNFDFETLPTVPGDNRVTVDGSTIPEGIPHQVYETKLGHGEVLNDPIVLQILKILIN